LNNRTNRLNRINRINRTIALLLLLGIAAAPLAAQNPAAASGPQKIATQPMTVEIWSDVMCPFCYIGKRKFEAALAQFAGRDSVRVIWRSFQLNPDLQTDTSKTVAQSLAEQKGWTAEQTAEAIGQVSRMAKTVGLDYHFERAVVANSFDAHRFSQLAAAAGKQNEAEERLFAAYFSEGKNTADHRVLAEIGASIGLDVAAVLAALASEAQADAVRADIALAQQFGINAVPFFVFDRKFAVSGAQDAGVFLQTLEKAAADRP
jgi:predicted DsbA family dithiol-disulfide isomerase